MEKSMKTVLIFGASGDLTARKLIPALFALFVAEKLREPLTVIGVSRTPMSDALWRRRLAESARRAMPDFDESAWRRFAPRLFYFSGDVDDFETFRRLDRFAANEEDRERKRYGIEKTDRIYYLALAPERYVSAVAGLGASGMARQNALAHRRLVIEKPFGRDLFSARKLDERIHAVFDEDQVYRIDHYLGKETVNNLFVLRFANTVFEPIWNRSYIDHIQITANESETVGRRGAFYETAGVLRDMFQNHLLQLMAIAMMEPPGRFDAKSVRDEKVKVLRAVRWEEPLDGQMSLGQYEGYRDEKNVAPDSRVPTFAALKLSVDLWRWKDVPVYLRSGKAMSCRTTQIVIQFKQPPHLIFEPLGGRFEANRLLIQIQPCEGIRLSFLVKIPGTEMQLQNDELVYAFDDKISSDGAYARLLLDALSGDPSLFARDDEIRAAWEIIDPFVRTAEEGNAPVSPYPKSGWGPQRSRKIIEPTARWFDLCPILK